MNEKSVFINFNMSNVFYDTFDPISKLLTIKGDIMISDPDGDNDINIGRLKIYTSSININNMSDFDFETFDSDNASLSIAVQSILDGNFDIATDILPACISDEISDFEILNLLYLDTIVIHENYRKCNILEQVFAILKMMFNHHLFLLKPYPVQHSARHHANEYKSYKLPQKKIPLSTGISKLVQTYSQYGFLCLLEKTKEPYMVMLNYVY